MTHPDALPEPDDHREGSLSGRSRRPHREFRRPPTDLEVLRSHPSLTGLAWRGWSLDRLPTTSTAVAFGGAVFVSLLSFGVPGALLVVLGLMLALPLTASALIHRDVVAARTVLRIARGGLLAWLVVAGLFLRPGWVEDGDATDRPARAPSQGVTASNGTDSGTDSGADSGANSGTAPGAAFRPAMPGGTASEADQFDTDPIHSPSLPGE